MTGCNLTRSTLREVGGYTDLTIHSDFRHTFRDTFKLFNYYYYYPLTKT